MTGPVSEYITTYVRISLQNQPELHLHFQKHAERPVRIFAERTTQSALSLSFIMLLKVSNPSSFSPVTAGVEKARAG